VTSVASIFTYHISSQWSKTQDLVWTETAGKELPSVTPSSLANGGIYIYIGPPICKKKLEADRIFGAVHLVMFTSGRPKPRLNY